MFTFQECEVLRAGLDLFARQQKDVVQAAGVLVPIRQKLDQCALQAAKEDVKSKDGDTDN